MAEPKLTQEQRFDAAVEQMKVLARRLGFMRTVLIVGVASFLIDVAVTVWVGVLTVVVSDNVHHNQRVEDCRSARSAAFFAAERAKVAGQVAGLNEIKTADGDRAKATEGFNMFIRASQRYLDTIDRIGGACS